jgi:hypothetical protein
VSIYCITSLGCEVHRIVLISMQCLLHSQGYETEVLTECIDISINVLIKVVIYISHWYCTQIPFSRQWKSVNLQ